MRMRSGATWWNRTKSSAAFCDRATMIWPRSAYCRAISWRKTRQRGVTRCSAALQRPQPAREQEDLPRGHGSPGPAVRLEDVAMPAHAHVVDHVQRQARPASPRPPRRTPAANGPADLVGDDGQRPRLRGELPRDDVDFVSALGQFLGRSDRSIAPGRRGADRSVRRPGRLS